MDRIVAEAFADELQKIAWDSKGFKEGLLDEGIPLGGAVAGATLGARMGSKASLRNAALGYAAGGALSLLRGKKKVKTAEEGDARRVLGASAMGYGAGGLAHWGLSKMKSVRVPHAGWKGALLEEGLPALGATLATGAAMATRKKQKTANASALQKGIQTLGTGRAAVLTSGMKPLAPAAKKAVPSAAEMLQKIKQMKGSYGTSSAQAVRI